MLIDALGLDFATSPDGIICLIVGAIIGAIATQVWRKGLGMLGNIVLGAVGGVLSGYLFDLVNIMDVGDYADPIIAAVIGAVIVLAVANMLRR